MRGRNATSVLCITSLKTSDLSWPHFSIFGFGVCNRQIRFKVLWMVGFELRISGVGNDRSATCAATTAQ